MVVVRWVWAAKQRRIKKRKAWKEPENKLFFLFCCDFHFFKKKMARTKQTMRMSTRTRAAFTPPAAGAAPAPPAKKKRNRIKRTSEQLEQKRLRKYKPEGRIKLLKMINDIHYLGKRRKGLPALRKVFRERYKKAPVYITIKHGRS